MGLGTKSAGILLTMVLLASPAFSSRDDVCDADPLPEEAQRVLKERFPSMYFEKPSDLSQEYRKQWFEKHPEECPGLTSGHFLGLTKRSYAVLLVGSKGALSGAKVVVMAETSGKWRPIVVNDERMSYYYQAIYKVARKGGLDGLGLITFEQGSKVYRYVNGKFR
ncbi:MAG TPA: hypothetical protein VFA68_01485 [Terriglobales bacterium]|nr:hypothetical protein [Terriglobales bacterium]